MVWGKTARCEAETDTTKYSICPPTQDQTRSNGKSQFLRFQGGDTPKVGTAETDTTKYSICPPYHPRVDARQFQKSIQRMYGEIDVKSLFPLPLTSSMARTAELNCSSKNLGWNGENAHNSQNAHFTTLCRADACGRSKQWKRHNLH